MYDNPFRISANPRKNPILKNCNDNEQDFFFYYFTKLVNLALSRYQYDGAPEEIPPYMLESFLLWSGNCLFFRDKISGLYAVTKVALTGDIDIYNIPTDRIAYASSIPAMEFDKEDSVLCWARPFAVPEIEQIIVHCNTLVNMRISRDMNIIQQRTPVIIAGTQDARLDSANLVKKILSGIPFIRVNKNFSGNMDITPLNFNIPNVFNDITSGMLFELSEALAELGIESTGISKQQRVTSSETSYNNGEIEMARNSGLMMRQRFCKQINKMFGLDMSVRFNSDLYTPVNLENYFQSHGNTPNPMRGSQTPSGEDDRSYEDKTQNNPEKTEKGGA